jgi:hypothetical protein
LPARIGIGREFPIFCEIVLKGKGRNLLQKRLTPSLYASPRGRAGLLRQEIDQMTRRRRHMAMRSEEHGKLA